MGEAKAGRKIDGERFFMEDSDLRYVCVDQRIIEKDGERFAAQPRKHTFFKFILHCAKDRTTAIVGSVPTLSLYDQAPFS